jgi:zinc-ribbon domain
VTVGAGTQKGVRMAFCEDCGSQITEVAKFCAACGQPVREAVALPRSTPFKRRSFVLRFILVSAALLVLLGCLGVGTAYYFLHRSSKNTEVTQGLPDLNSTVNALPNPAPKPPTTPMALPVPNGGLDENRIVISEDGQCALFTKEELTRVLGTNFTHADADATGCTYKGDAPRLWVRTEATWKDGRQLVKAKSDNYKSLRQSMINQHYSKEDVDSHVFPMQPYPGVGDEAWVNLWNVVTARKGDAGVTIDLRYYHDSDDLTKMLTNTALARLRDKKPDSVGSTGQSVQ